MSRSSDSEAALASESALDSDLVSAMSAGCPAAPVIGITPGTDATAAAFTQKAFTAQAAIIFTTDGRRFTAVGVDSQTSTKHLETITFARE
jgi:hypothetical protein